MIVSDAVWDIGHFKQFGVGPFSVFLFRHQRAMESNESIELGVIFNYMANRYVEWRTTDCEVKEKEKKKKGKKNLNCVSSMVLRAVVLISFRVRMVHRIYVVKRNFGTASKSCFHGFVASFDLWP